MKAVEKVHEIIMREGIGVRYINKEEEWKVKMEEIAQAIIDNLDLNEVAEVDALKILNAFNAIPLSFVQNVERKKGDKLIGKIDVELLQKNISKTSGLLKWKEGR